MVHKDQLHVEGTARHLTHRHGLASYKVLYDLDFEAWIDRRGDQHLEDFSRSGRSRRGHGEVKAASLLRGFRL